MFKKLGAEFIATFAMVFFGTGAIVLNDITGGRVGLLGIAVAFGGSITAMIYLLGPVSGAHMNPAVTLSLASAKKLRPIVVLPYVCAQFAGAILGSYLLSLLFPDHATLGATTPQGSIVQSFIIEIFLGFVLILTILQIVSRPSVKRLPAAVIIGSIVALGAIFAGHISGASINPARSLAPALISGEYSGLWIYLMAPVMGGILAVPVSSFFDRSFCTGQKPAIQEFR